MSLAQSIFEQLELTQTDTNVFQGVAENHGQGRVFGGQIIGQALTAASHTVGDRPCHSLHTYFLRPGDPSLPVNYEVDRIRDGGSFTTRRVLGIQKGKAILSMSASFQAFEDGLAHQIDMPDVPGPDALPSDQELLEQRRVEFPDISDQLLQMVHGARPVEIKQVEDFTYFKPEKRPPVKHVWYRSRYPLGENPLRHQCLLAYASDVGFLSTSNMPHGKSFMTGLMMASIDHSLWFHRPFSFDNWILIAMESTVSANSRAFIRASMFTQDGVLIGSATQEGLIRSSD